MDSIYKEFKYLPVSAGVSPVVVSLAKIDQSKRLRIVFFMAMTLLCSWIGRSSAKEVVVYYYTSPQGTVLSMADAIGNIISNSDYTPYGAHALGTPNQGLGYTGHIEDLDTGLVYMQARYYDPSAARFLSVDPLSVTPGSMLDTNRYSYANDNPVVFQDPSGRCTGPNNIPDAPCNPSSARDSAPREPVRPHADCSTACQRMRDTSDRRGGSSVQPGQGFVADGFLAGRPTLAASGVAALGVGVKATKGLYHSDSNISLVTPAIGLRASAETTLIKVGYDGNQSSGQDVKIGYGINIAEYAILGGGLSIEYTPPYKVEVGVDLGAGAGVSINIYSVGKDFKENN
ncbi:RHS repeat-associated core domain-containing protein [Luteibacter sp. PPL201]|uniref:RHS repeat-associated core domain-containing protein n=1 Tax=Luteibacter sahnii TaxID=3021977 RepID=A0ABT6BC42_9GAMM